MMFKKDNYVAVINTKLKETYFKFSLNISLMNPKYFNISLG